MKVQRMVKTDVSSFEVGDVIKFKLDEGEKVEAMAVKQEADGMIFCLVDCLAKEYPMNKRNTNDGGYAECDLRGNLNGEILDRFPLKIKKSMVAFENGDYLRLPTEKEIFGENPYATNKADTVEQWRTMEKRRNRIAFQGKNGAWEWYWLQNKVEDSASYFANVSSNGLANSSSASPSHGVRPAFKI